MSRVDYVFDRQFEAGHEYVVYVTQVNKAGLESEFSDPAFITAGRSEALIAPTLNIDDCFCDGDDISANISWVDNQLDPDLACYRVYLSKGTATWFNGDGYYTDEFPSNVRTFEVDRDHFDLILENLDIDATYTIGIETIDFYGNVSLNRYVTTFVAEDNSPVSNPSNEINGEAVGYWSLQISTHVPDDPNAKYIQFFRDGTTPLPAIDCRSSQAGEDGFVSIIDTLAYGLGRSHRYSYQIIRFDGKRSTMSPLSEYFTARTIDESALDPNIKEQWKEDFTRELEDRVATLELQHQDHDRKISNLQNDLNQISREFRRDIDRLFNRISDLEEFIENFADTVENGFRVIHDSLANLQNQINRLSQELRQKADKSYVDDLFNRLNSQIRDFIASELARITEELQAYVRSYTSRFALKTYVDQKLEEFDRTLRAYINQLIDSLRNQVTNDIQGRIQNLTQNTVPSMINSATNALETRLQAYARNQDANLRASLLSEISSAESRCINRCQQVYNNAVTTMNNAISNVRSSIMNEINRLFGSYCTYTQMTQYVQSQLNSRIAILQTSLTTSITNSIRSEIYRQIEQAKTVLRNEFDAKISRLQTSINNVTAGANRYTDSQITLLRVNIENLIRGLQTRMTSVERQISNLQEQIENAIGSINSMTSSTSVDASAIYQYCKQWFQHILEEGCSFTGAVQFTDVYISRSLTLYNGATTRGITNQGITPSTQTINRHSNTWYKLPNNRTNQGRMGIINQPISLNINSSNQNSFIAVKYTALLAIAYSVNLNESAYSQYRPHINGWRVFLGRSNENNGGADGTILWSNTTTIRDSLVNTTNDRIVTNGGDYQNVLTNLLLNVPSTSKSIYFCTLNAEWSGTVARSTTSLPLYVFLYADPGAHTSYVREICVTREVFTISTV